MNLPFRQAQYLERSDRGKDHEVAERSSGDGRLCWSLCNGAIGCQARCTILLPSTDDDVAEGSTADAKLKLFVAEGPSTTLPFRSSASGRGPG